MDAGASPGGTGRQDAQAGVQADAVVGPVPLAATAAAQALVAQLAARHGALQFVLSHGCCDGSTPMCLTLAEFQPGPGDVLLGHVGTVPFRAAQAHLSWLAGLQITLDVAPGDNGAFSLEDGSGQRFVLRMQAR